MGIRRVRRRANRAGLMDARASRGWMCGFWGRCHLRLVGMVAWLGLCNLREGYWDLGPLSEIQYGLSSLLHSNTFVLGIFIALVDFFSRIVGGSSAF